MRDAPRTRLRARRLSRQRVQSRRARPRGGERSAAPSASLRDMRSAIRFQTAPPALMARPAGSASAARRVPSRSAATTAPCGPVPATAVELDPMLVAPARRAFGDASGRRAARSPSQVPSRGSSVASGCALAWALAAARRRQARARARPAPEHEGDRLADGDVVALGGAKPASVPSAGASTSTVTLSVSISISGSPLHDLLALRLQPAEDLARLLRHPERRHDHVGRHYVDRRSLEPRGRDDGVRLPRRCSGSTASRGRRAGARRPCSGRRLRRAAPRPGSA